MDHGNSLAIGADHKKAGDFPNGNYKKHSQEIGNYHITYVFGTVLMHRTGEVVWEKQLLSLALERPGTPTRPDIKGTIIILLKSACDADMHVCGVNYEEYMLQVEGQALTANIMTCMVGTAPLNI